MISKIFLQEQQIILSAGGDIHSPEYFRKVGELTAALSAIPQIDSVQSLTRGPRNTDDALKSPLWKRFLFSSDQKASFIYVFIKRNASVEDGVLKIEKIKQRFNSPDFPIMISGAPYIVELISRNLLRDLKVFSVAAFCFFGLSGLLISRSIAMVLGTLIACTNASALTLILTHASGIPIGPLTANLSTIVFVLTLTHMVFMTFNWRHIIRKKEASIEKAWLKAVRVTLLPSFWSMLTALLGFLSLLSVPATPLRQLGLSGAMGTVVAFSSAYVIYPFFLRMQTPRDPAVEKAGSKSMVGPSFFRSKHVPIIAVVLLATAAASTGIGELNTDPSLFSYFKKGSELRNSLEYIDQNGGSTPLNVVLENPNGEPFKIRKDYQRLWSLQSTLESDPAVGSIMSLPLLLSEAKRKPLASLIPINWLMKLLERPILGKAAIYYITKDHTKTLFVLKMKESYKQSDHLKNVERLKGTIRKQGFEPTLVGGTYLLFGRLSKLVASSMADGLTLLIVLFMIMGGSSPAHCA
ncbi:MAG: MMPL family transporter [Methanothrix sp.]|nr:MMPL family transporter [Methanothrix sp.]